MNQPITENPAQARLKPRLFTRYFFIIALVNVLAGTALQFFNATTTLYVQSLGGTASFAGFCLTLMTAAATVTRILSGRLSDTKGRRVIIVVGLAIFALSSVSFNLFTFLGALPVLRFIQGVGYSLSTTALSVAITDVTPKQRMGEGIGYFGLGQTITSALGPAIAMGLIIDGDYKFVFYAAAIFLIVGAVIMFFCNYEKNMDPVCRQRLAESRGEEVSGAKSEKKPRGVAALFEKSALPCTVISLFNSIAMGATVAFLMAYATEIGIGKPGLYFTISAILMVVVRLGTGKLTDRFPPASLLVPGFIINAACFVCLLFAAYNPLLYYIAGACAGIAGGITGPVLQASVIRMVPDNRRGAAMATYIEAPAHFRSLYFCLSVLSGFSNLYGTNAKIQQVLVNCYQSSSVRSHEKRVAISAIATLKLNTPEITNDLIHRFAESRSSYERLGVYEYLQQSHLCDENVDFLLLGIKYLNYLSACIIKIHWIIITACCYPFNYQMVLNMPRPLYAGRYCVILKPLNGSRKRNLVKVKIIGMSIELPALSY